MQPGQEGRKKKLIDAARHWASRPARSATITDKELEDPPEWQAAIEAHEHARNSESTDDDQFPVWSENWDTVVVFCNLRRCWRIDSMTGSFLGIIRTEIESTLRLMRVDEEKHTEIFEKLMVMEDAALGVMNRR